MSKLRAFLIHLSISAAIVGTVFVIIFFFWYPDPYFRVSGANDIVRETFDSSVRASRYALQALGMHPFDAERSATVFVDHDLDAIRRMAKLWDPNLSSFENKAYADAARDNTQALRNAMKNDRSTPNNRSERAWTPHGGIG